MHTFMFQSAHLYTSNDPHLQDFTNVLPLCFPVAGSKEAWNLTEDVSVAFQARLSVSPTTKYAVVMISFTDALMEFTREGQVIVA
jgi:hypothetical protein